MARWGFTAERSSQTRETRRVTAHDRDTRRKFISDEGEEGLVWLRYEAIYRRNGRSR